MKFHFTQMPKMWRIAWQGMSARPYPGKNVGSSEGAMV
jgi:hypothetical protein